MVKRPQRLILVALLALSAALLLRTALNKEKPAAAPSGGEEKQPFATIENLVYTRTVDGVVQWQMQSDEGLYYADDKRLDLRQVNGTIFSSDRRITLKGDNGRVFLNTRTASLEGGVVGRTDDGYVLYTKRLDFAGDSHQIHTDEAVLIEGKNVTVQGVGMDADLKKQTFVLRQAVKATFGAGGAS
jgi:LPS export ABC transporter protein LptC